MVNMVNVVVHVQQYQAMVDPEGNAQLIRIDSLFRTSYSPGGSYRPAEKAVLPTKFNPQVKVVCIIRNLSSFCTLGHT